MSRTRTPSNEMFAHVESWQQSGLSQKAYCLQHQIAYHLFPYWLKRYRLHSAGKGFMAVEVSMPAASSSPVLELVIANGSRLLFYSQPDASYLQSLLA